LNQRFAKFEKIVDEEVSYGPQNNMRQGTCRLRIFRGGRPKFGHAAPMSYVIVATDLGKGLSITNGIEYIAHVALDQVGHVNPARLLLFEHYPKWGVGLDKQRNHVDWVTLDFYGGQIRRFSNPVWFQVEPAWMEALIGEAL
jgi:hypothetical protein